MNLYGPADETDDRSGNASLTTCTASASFFPAGANTERRAAKGEPHALSLYARARSSRASESSGAEEKKMNHVRSGAILYFCALRSTICDESVARKSGVIHVCAILPGRSRAAKFARLSCSRLGRRGRGLRERALSARSHV